MATPAKRPKYIDFTILRDNQEKKNYWQVAPYIDSEFRCLGTKVKSLDTGDYTIEGHEDKISVERKLTTGELAINMFEKRFERELERLDDFKFPYMIFQFNYTEIKTFPVNSGIPKEVWPKLKMTASTMEKILARYLIQYRTKIIFAGIHGESALKTIFRQYLQYGASDVPKT